MTTRYLFTFDPNNDQIEWRDLVRRKVVTLCVISLITIVLSLSCIVNHEFAISPFSGNPFMVFGETLSKLFNLCATVASGWLIINSWLLFKVTNSTRLVPIITAPISGNYAIDSKLFKIMDILIMTVCLSVLHALCFGRFGMTIDYVILMLASICWLPYAYSLVINLVWYSYLIYRTCVQLELNLNGIKRELEGLSNVNGKVSIYISRFKLKRCLKQLNHQMVTHSQLNQYWKSVISSTMVSFVTYTAVSMTTWLVSDVSLWTKLMVNMGSLVLFTPVSMMVLMVAHVDSRNRAIYRTLAKICVSTKIGHSLKMKLSYACTRFRRPIGFTQADGSAIDYMSYHEVGYCHCGQTFFN